MSTNNNNNLILYGQDDCITKLVNTCNNYVKQRQRNQKQKQQRNQQLVLLVGPSGNGKTSLGLSFLHQQLQDCYYAIGRIDYPEARIENFTHQGGPSFGPLLHICQQLISQLLIVDSKKETKKFIKAIQASITTKNLNSILMSNLFPELKLLFPTTTTTTTTTTNNDTKIAASSSPSSFYIYNGNMKLVIIQILRAISSIGKPVVIFVDDLHHVVVTTTTTTTTTTTKSSICLDVFKLILSDPKIHFLLMVGFRPIPVSHPTSIWIQNLESTMKVVNNIEFIPIMPKPITNPTIVKEWMIQIGLLLVPRLPSQKTDYDVSSDDDGSSDDFDGDQKTMKMIQNIIKQTNGNACSIHLYLQVMKTLLKNNDDDTTTTVTTIQDMLSNTLQQQSQQQKQQSSTTILQSLFKINFDMMSSKTQKICQIASCMSMVVETEIIQQIIGDENCFSTIENDDDNNDDENNNDTSSCLLSFDDALKEAERYGILQYYYIPTTSGGSEQQPSSTTTANEEEEGEEEDEFKDCKTNNDNDDDDDNDDDSNNNATTSGGYYKFTNTTYRDCIYDDLIPSKQRFMYHAAIGNIYRREIIIVLPPQQQIVDNNNNSSSMMMMMVGDGIGIGSDDLPNLYRSIEHLVIGRSLLNMKQLEMVSKLCLLAGNLSNKNWQEYQSALRYYDLGLDLLGLLPSLSKQQQQHQQSLTNNNNNNKNSKSKSKDYHQLVLNLFNCSAEVYYRLGQYNKMNERLQEILNDNNNIFGGSNNKTMTTEDKIVAYTIQIKSLVSQSRHGEALRIGLNLLQEKLEEFDIHQKIYSSSQKEEVTTATRKLLEGKSSDEILGSLPKMVDQIKLGTMDIMNSLLVPALIMCDGDDVGGDTSGPSSSLVISLACRIVKATLRYGITGPSIVGLCLLGAIICTTIEDGNGEVDDGLWCTNVGLQLIDVLDNNDEGGDSGGGDGGNNYSNTNGRSNNNFSCYRGRAMAIHWGFMVRYIQPLPTCQEPLKVAYRLCMESGDINFAPIIPVLSAFNMIVAGGALSSTAETLKSLYQMLLKKNQDTLLRIVRPFFQMTLNLLGVSGESDPTILTGSIMVEQEDYTYAIKTKNIQIEYCILLCQSILAFYMHKFESARESMEKCIAITEPGILLSTLDIQVCFFNAMTSVGLVWMWTRKMNMDTDMNKKEYNHLSEQKAIHISNAERCLGKLRILARYAPENLQQRIWMVEAELNSINGKIDEGEKLFMKAMEHAEQYGQFSDRALACERAGLALRACDREDHALDYLEDCCAMYRQWGALIKVNHIKGNVIPQAIFDWDA